MARAVAVVILAVVLAWALAAAIVFALYHGRPPVHAGAVVVASDGRPVGVVTRSDLLEYLAHVR